MYFSFSTLNNKLIVFGKTPCSYGQNRKGTSSLDQISYRTYGRYTHSYISDNEERLECIPCNSNCSIKHILIDCVDVADVRQTLYNVNTIPGIRFIYKCRRRHNFEMFKRN